MSYLATQKEWEAAAEYAYKAGVMGFDTETYGHNVKESSPAYRAKIHVWSIAFYTGQLHPRGYLLARGACLPAAALSCFKPVLESNDVLKVAHNKHHDEHGLENRGIKLGKSEDTLDLVRLAYPERALDLTKGFKLKPLSYDLLGKPHRTEYDDVVNDELPESTWHEKKYCVCGEPKCRRRILPDHAKVSEPYEVVKWRKVVYPLEEIVPGHKHWELLWPYAMIDAVDALELRSLAMNKLGWLEKKLPPLPW